MLENWIETKCITSQIQIKKRFPFWFFNSKNIFLHKMTNFKKIFFWPRVVFLYDIAKLKIVLNSLLKVQLSLLILKPKTYFEKKLWIFFVMFQNLRFKKFPKLGDEKLRLQEKKTNFLLEIKQKHQYKKKTQQTKIFFFQNSFSMVLTSTIVSWMWFKWIRTWNLTPRSRICRCRSALRISQSFRRSNITWSSRHC